MSTTPGKLLGIDHGIKRIGLAVCDASWMVARELTIIHRKSKAEDFEKINRIVADERVIGIIIGLPLNEMGADGYSQADTVRLWVERFSMTTDLPILLWDEQLSSEEATELAIHKKRKIGEPIDDLAARVILQRYLDDFREGFAPSVLEKNG